MKIGGWPQCAVCRRAVEEMESYLDYRAGNDWVFVARCHGAREEHRLSLSLLRSIQSIDFSWAFISPGEEKLYDHSALLPVQYPPIAGQGIG